MLPENADEELLVEDVDEADEEAECDDGSAFGEAPGGGGRNNDGLNRDAAAA